ncbi:hypothetical protein BH160DRAFT_5605 [Burkholderia sp. H160]|nr:hypothetical protein BH160DRAFT_5605 [Burkholderia sp. H160]
MKTLPQSTDGDPQASRQADPHAKRPRSLPQAEAPLPHETDQHPESQHEDHPRHVGKQAHKDVEHELQDTDRRGREEYQQRTQNGSHTDVNSVRKLGGAIGKLVLAGFRDEVDAQKARPRKRVNTRADTTRAASRLALD